MSDPTTQDDFRSQVQRLEAEGKLTAEEAAGLLEGMTDSDQDGSVGLRAIPEPGAAGEIPPHLILEVAGYALQVVVDESLPAPQLQASQEGKLSLDPTPDGWRVKRQGSRNPRDWTGLSALLLVPFTPVDVQVTLGGGSLKVPDIHGDLKVKLGGGSLTMGGAAGLNASIGGGNLKAELIHGPAQVTVGGGSVMLGSRGPMTATVAGGSLLWRAHLAQGEHSVTVAGGSARIELEPGSSVRLDAHATAGSVKTNFPVERTGQFATYTYRGVVGEGHAKLGVRVAGGSVAVSV